MLVLPRVFLRALHSPRALAGLLGLTVSLLALAALAKPLRGDLLGIRLGMSESEVHDRLKRIGKRTEEHEDREEESKEIWTLRDRRYGSLAVAFDSDLHVQWMTVFVRRSGKGVKFADLGDVSTAHRGGNYIYTWVLPAEPGARRTALTARGVDSLHVNSISIHPPIPTTDDSPSRPAPTDSTR